ncbi:BMA-DMA-1 [Dirofilaria immitis]|nr:BMA-DMA-1 [Dirofilaria immitis]
MIPADRRCPSITIFITGFYIIISSWPIIEAATTGVASDIAKDIKNYEIKYISEVKGYQNIIKRFHRDKNNIQILNSHCPNFCGCGHIIWDNGTDSITEISVFCHEGNLEQIAFSKLLKQIPKEVAILDVEAPLNHTNHLLWDDNLNQLRYLCILRLINREIPAISRALKLPMLEVLDLQGNQIQHLPVSIFSGVSSIRELNLAKNLLSYQQVNLHGNPFDCTCHVEELKRYMLDRYVYRHELQYKHTYCITPEYLKGSPIYRLNHIGDCTLLFGAHNSLLQLSEITILFLFLTVFALSIALLILFAYDRLKRREKIALTLLQHLSSTSTSLIEPLTPPPESPISEFQRKCTITTIHSS